jgi:hypothetical protein
MYTFRFSSGKPENILSILYILSKYFSLNKKPAQVLLLIFVLDCKTIIGSLNNNRIFFNRIDALASHVTMDHKWQNPFS